jgi:hypothetical protein
MQKPPDPVVFLCAAKCLRETHRFGVFYNVMCTFWLNSLNYSGLLRTYRSTYPVHIGFYKYTSSAEDRQRTKPQFYKRTYTKNVYCICTANVLT